MIHHFDETAQPQLIVLQHQLLKDILIHLGPSTCNPHFGRTKAVQMTCLMHMTVVLGNISLVWGSSIFSSFILQPKWNDALLEMFRIDYVGTSSYMNCLPSLHHHRLGPNDRFLILSSDGLYQYFTNEEAVSEVELFTSLYPDGDPAQHLVEEVLFRAAKKAGKPAL